MFEIEDSCIVCVAKPLLICGSFIGLYPFFWKCTHWNTKHKARFQTSFLLVSLSVLIGALILASGCYEFYHGFQADSIIWEVENIRAVGQLLWSLNNSVSIMIMAVRSAQMKNIFVMMNISLNSIYAADKTEIIRKLYDSRRAILLFWIAFVIAISPVTLNLNGAHTLIFMQIPKVYVCCVICLSMIASPVGLITSLEMSVGNIRRVLEIRRENMHLNITNNVQDDVKQFIATRLINHRLVLAINRYLSPPTTIYVALFLPILFVLMYTAVLDIGTHGKDVLIVRMFWLPELLIVQLICEQYYRLANLNESFLSYLYRYPISKLSRQERQQIQTLIMVMRNQQFTVRPSNMFAISKRLASLVVYLIGAYVIVGLQFYISNTKQLRDVE